MMYNYYDAVQEDVNAWIDDNINFEDFADLEELGEYLNNTLWIDDGVTGNASGSYFCNSWHAEECIAHNWDLLAQALGAFGDNGADVLEKGAEWCDVTIRCYVLADCIAETLEKYADKFAE